MILSSNKFLLIDIRAISRVGRCQNVWKSDVSRIAPSADHQTVTITRFWCNFV